MVDFLVALVIGTAVLRARPWLKLLGPTALVDDIRPPIRLPIRPPDRLSHRLHIRAVEQKPSVQPICVCLGLLNESIDRRSGGPPAAHRRSPLPLYSCDGP